MLVYKELKLKYMFHCFIYLKKKTKFVYKSKKEFRYIL